jgi:hypothetical protein
MTITSTPRTGPPVRHDDVPPNNCDVNDMAGIVVIIAFSAVVVGLLRFPSGRRNTSV